MALSNPRFLILGAGVSGLAMGHGLRKAGYQNFTILEKGDSVGGTWRENRYPGCACDVPSHLYSFSFDKNPSWSEKFSPADEIHAYLKGVAKRHRLTPHIRLKTRALSARHDGREWIITLAGGTEERGDFLISGVGGLHEPHIPDLPGLAGFAGPAFHTARWDDSVSLTGKRVAIIGSAASAVQVAPAIAGQVSQLDIYQRTANYVLPRNNRLFTGLSRAAFANIPGLAEAYRAALFALYDGRFPAFANEDHWMRRIAMAGFRRHLARTVTDPDLRQKLRPDYPLGCKRILISDDFYRMFNAPNVALITDPIDRVEADAIRLSTGKTRPADVLVLATGFEPFNASKSVTIENARGTRLADIWREGISAYKTVSVPDFPNYFMLLGPNSGVGHTSAIAMIEAQTRYILQLVERMQGSGLERIAPDPWVARQYDERLQARLATHIWSTGCNSWYLDKDGRNFTLYPGSARAFARDLSFPDLTAYRPV